MNKTFSLFLRKNWSLNSPYFNIVVRENYKNEVNFFLQGFVFALLFIDFCFVYELEKGQILPLWFHRWRYQMGTLRLKGIFNYQSIKKAIFIFS